MRSSMLVGVPLVIASAAIAQQPAAPAQQPAAPAAQLPPALDSGAVAPDFALPGSSAGQLLAHPVRLSDYAGKTVVVAFFFKSRTRG